MRPGWSSIRNYVYLWRDPKNGIFRYVGKGVDDRVWFHLTQSCDSHISKMLRKRNREGFVCLPSLIWVNSDKEACELEILLIAEIGRQDLGKGPLFNLTDGGDGQAGYVWTEEQKLRHSKRLSG